MLDIEKLIKDVEPVYIKHFPNLNYLRYFKKDNMEIIKLDYNDQVIHLLITNTDPWYILKEILNAMFKPDRCCSIIEYSAVQKLRELELIDDLGGDQTCLQD